MSSEIEEAWGKDLLGRKNEGEFLIELIRARHTAARAQSKEFSLVLNLDADWGYGKSYFLRHLGLQLAREGHIVASVDAWSTDFASDPLVPVMAAIEQAIEPHLDKKEARDRWEQAKQNAGAVMLAVTGGLLRGVANRVLPGAIDAAASAFHAEETEVATAIEEGVMAGSQKAIDTLMDGFATASLDEFTKTTRSVAAFRRDLALVLDAAATSAVPTPMFVLIDELDRCRPTYAVAMLERIKHLFQIPGVVFVVATNSSELQHSIGAVYGAQFAASRYLHRFFDMRYRLSEPERGALVAKLLTDFPDIAAFSGYAIPGANLAEYLKQLFHALDMSVRDSEQCMALLGTVLSIWPKGERPLLGVLFPLACAHQLRIGGQDLATTARALRSALKNKNWRAETQEISVDVITILDVTVQLVATGFRELNKADYQNGINGWVTDKLFDGLVGRRFGVEFYQARLERAGRFTPPLEG